MNDKKNEEQQSGEFNIAEYTDIIGNRIGILRNKLGLTRSAFANRLGTYQRFITSWEAGKTLPSTPYILKICFEFNVPLAYFDPRIEDADPLNFDKGTPEFERMKEKVDWLFDEMKELIVRVNEMNEED